MNYFPVKAVSVFLWGHRVGVIAGMPDGVLRPPTILRDAISPQLTLSLTTGRISMRCR